MALGLWRQLDEVFHDVSGKNSTGLPSAGHGHLPKPITQIIWLKRVNWNWSGMPELIHLRPADAVVSGS